jgi:hypothetical protein
MSLSTSFFEQSRGLTIPVYGDGNRPPPPPKRKRRPEEDPPQGKRYDIAMCGGIAWTAATIGVTVADTSDVPTLIMEIGSVCYALLCWTGWFLPNSGTHDTGSHMSPALHEKIIEAVCCSAAVGSLVAPLTAVAFYANTFEPIRLSQTSKFNADALSFIIRRNPLDVSTRPLTPRF